MRAIMLNFVIWTILIQTVDVKTEGIAEKMLDLQRLIRGFVWIVMLAECILHSKICITQYRG